VLSRSSLGGLAVLDIRPLWIARALAAQPVGVHLMNSSEDVVALVLGKAGK
jgi:hypothetical protein